MLDLDYLKKLAVKKQTSAINIIREYCQNLFLSSFYSKTGADNFLFKGGTALKIIFNSPRYSEDLDFSAASIDNLEDIFLSVFQDLEKEGVRIEKIPESKPTTNGYFALFDFTMPFEFFNPRIQINVWLKGTKPIPQAALVNNDFIPAYTLIHLNEKELVNEKIQAFSGREKARDYFDLLLILRNDRLRNLIGQSPDLKTTILDKLDRFSDETLKKELRQFIPVGHQQVFTLGGLKENIRRAVETYL